MSESQIADADESNQGPSVSPAEIGDDDELEGSATEGQEGDVTNPGVSEDGSQVVEEDTSKTVEEDGSQSIEEEEGEDGPGTVEKDGSKTTEEDNGEQSEEDCSEVDDAGDVEKPSDTRGSEEEPEESEGETDPENNEESEEEDSDTSLEKCSHFEMKLEAELIQDTVEAVGCLVDECRIHLTTGGLEIKAVDPANVGMVETELQQKSFDIYRIDEGVIGVNLDRFDEILSMANKDDRVRLALDPSSGKMNIEFNGLEFTMALIDPDSIRQEPDIPDLDLGGDVKLTSDKLHQIVKASDMVSDHVELGMSQRDENTFFGIAEGDTDDVKVEYEEDNLVHFDFSSGDASFYSIFSLEYVREIKKVMPSDTTVTVQLGDEMPTKISYRINNKPISVLFMLAPRIKS